MMKKFLILLIILVINDSYAAQEGRVIVKYKSTANLIAQPINTRTVQLSRRLGLAVHLGRNLNTHSVVVRSAAMSSTELAKLMANQDDVEYAVPDKLRKIRTLPNDTLFSEQWYLQSIQPAAIRADRAWEVTTGAAEIIVAVVDTGIRYEHPDFAGKLLTGYDFISDAVNANDGDSRDNDASDMGDYISQADLANSALSDLCGDLTLQHSTWHGTRVAGILGAATNNSLGIAGTSWGAKILPVRVMGKCGGFDSDIIAGMRWAAGIEVPGVPKNANPARIINLSLGGAGACDNAYTEVINDLTNLGVTVVTAVSNESGEVGAPANCPGVIAVAGIRHNGIKVGYSGFGPEITISAPAGNCVNLVGNCLYGISTTSNSGATNPAENFYDSFNVGTSFAAPQVAGVAALMLSVNTNLVPAELIKIIKSSAQPFPVDSELTNCPSQPTNIDQCNCTTSSCGAGMINAEAAVKAVTLPNAQIQILDPLNENSTVRLDGSKSSAVSNRNITAWSWKLIAAPNGASLTEVSSPNTSLVTTGTGDYTVSLTVTDNFGASNSTQQTFNLTVNSSGGGGALDIYSIFGLILIIIRYRFSKK